MAIVTMSLYQALEQKKIFESQVSKLQAYRLVDLRRDGEDKNHEGIPLKDIDERIQAGYDKSVAVLNNYIALKAAINDTNAKTTITVNGETMSIANAIVRQRLLDKEENLYHVMLNNIVELEGKLQRYNEREMSPEAITRYVNGVLGDAKRDEEMIQKLTENYKREHGRTIYDPMNTREKAEKKLAEIDEFRKNIHYALTKVNVETMIEVVYED